MHYYSPSERQELGSSLEIALMALSMPEMAIRGKEGRNKGRQVGGRAYMERRVLDMKPLGADPKNLGWKKKIEIRLEREVQLCCREVERASPAFQSSRNRK
jgi:hypothetical protein